MGNHRGLLSDRFQSYYIMEFYRHIRNTQKLDIVEQADGRVSTRLVLVFGTMGGGANHSYFATMSDFVVPKKERHTSRKKE